MKSQFSQHLWNVQDSVLVFPTEVVSQYTSWLLHPIKSFYVFPYYSLLMNITYSSENFLWLCNIIFFFSLLLRLNFTLDFLWAIYSLNVERLPLTICSVMAKVFLLSFQYFKKNLVSFCTYFLGSIMSRDMMFSCFQEFVFLYG